MTADQDLFAPIGSGGKIGTIITLQSGIHKRPDATAIEIIPSNPKMVYLDEATQVMNHAAQLHSQMFDVRNPAKFPAGINLPKRAFVLHDLVDRFHGGNQEFWVSCPGLTAPQKFTFAGRFGHYKVIRFTQQILRTQIAQFVGEWFWLDTTDGQISAVELGTLVVHPKILLHHAFANSLDALSYYQS